MEDFDNITNSHIESLEDEKNDDFSNDDLFNITSWGTDPSVRELITMYDEKDIIKPELQRKYVWEKKESSRFVESILLGLPVPSLFFANTKDDTRLIIDGYQRIKTVVDYSKGIWSGDGSVFKLTNSKLINERWRNKSFNELSEDDRRRFRNYTIHAIIFEQREPKNDSGLFQVFERINTSGETLNPQEIRNCVYQGRLNSLLFKLNKYEKWRTLFGDKNEDKRMLDLEFILRFFALKEVNLVDNQNGYISLKKLLNDYMKDHIQSESSFFDSLESLFIGTIDFIYSNFGTEAFYNLQNDLQIIRRRFYPTVYDSIMIATSIAMEKGYRVTDCQLESKRITLLKDAEYRNSITQGTMQCQNIRTRIEKALIILYNMNL